MERLPSLTFSAEHMNPDEDKSSSSGMELWDQQTLLSNISKHIPAEFNISADDEATWKCPNLQNNF